MTHHPPRLWLTPFYTPMTHRLPDDSYILHTDDSPILHADDSPILHAYDSLLPMTHPGLHSGASSSIASSMLVCPLCLEMSLLMNV